MLSAMKCRGNFNKDCRETKGREKRFSNSTRESAVLVDWPLAIVTNTDQTDIVSPSNIDIDLRANTAFNMVKLKYIKLFH